MTTEHVDVAVVGLGSAGEALATALVAAGRSVVGFEPVRVGGECPFTACMPSKVLLHHASLEDPDWDDARAHRDEVVNGLDDVEHHDALVQTGIDVVRARARLAGERTVRAGEQQWTAGTVVLATGSVPTIPPIDGLDRTRIWTSEDLMTATELPASCVIVGGGAIGCESAAILAGFGRRVTLVEAAPRLLSGAVAPEVSARLTDRLAELGVDVRLEAEVAAIHHGRDHDEVTLRGEDPVRGERVLVAVGQAPAWDGLGLDTIGIDDAAVDDDFVVAGVDWLRAIGDLDGRSPWTHGANHEAARLTELLTGSASRAQVRGMVSCVFTDPPVASVGLTAAAAADAGHDVVTGSARYSDVARSSTDRTCDGVVVVVADRPTGALLGCSGIGPRFEDTVASR